MKFFTYARKSTDDEGRQVLSIDSQLDELREYARKEALTVVREYIEAQTAKADAGTGLSERRSREDGKRVDRPH